MIWSAITSIVGALVAPIFKLFEMWSVHRAGRKQGQAEQAAADARAGLEEARKANEARGNVGGTDSDVERLLKPPGARD